MGWDYWHPQVLIEFARTISVLLKVDASTLNGDFGHYARVLIDIDLVKPPLESLLFKDKDRNFYVYFEYENLPTLYTVCSFLGHIATIATPSSPRTTRIPFGPYLENVQSLDKSTSRSKLAP